ncbi:MAG: aminotransferase class V-fold PLP-dependent enzyme [Myxococcales bacterium]|nr:aminotransferase class V-fold PLP-dependent enzyme [Myxococcales bacterium]
MSTRIDETWSAGSPAVRSEWRLDPEVKFLNNGSFGATPRTVLDAVRSLHAEMEAEPVRFFARELPDRIALARTAVAAFVGADEAGLAFVSNATAGVNAVLRSFPWRAGDAMLLADQTYNAVKQTALWVSKRYGVELQWAKLPFPVQSPEDLVAPWLDAATPRTRLAVVDHVSSPTAVILPVQKILAALRDRGIPVLVDGAHAPGLLPLDLRALGADFYVGNLHKWAYAAKGSAILHVSETWREHIHPVSISHGYGQGLRPEFDWTGTTDPAPFLTAPEALDFWRRLDRLAEAGGIAESNHRLVQTGRALIADALHAELPHPDDPALYGPMAAIPWPDRYSGDFRQVADLNRRLYDDHRFEVPFSTYDDRIWLRISGQAYNHPDEYAALADVLRHGWR